MTLAPEVRKTSRTKRALGGFIGVDTPTFQIIAPYQPWKVRLRRWALRKAWRMVSKSARRFLWTWRGALAPWYAAMTVWVAAAIAGQVERGYVTIGGVALLGGAGMWWWLGGWAWRFTKRRNLKPMAQRYWHAAFYTALSAWAVTAAAWTALPPMAGVLWAMTMTVWVAWMWQRRTRPVLVEGVVERFDERSQRWARVAADEPAKPLRGAALENIQEHESPRRWEADVALPSGTLTVENVINNHRRICSAFSARRDNVIVDEAPGGAEDRAHLTVVLENPCHGAIEYDEGWQEPYAEGCVAFHTYPDGFRGGLRLWQPMSGTAHSMFSGDTRSGKSAGMEAGTIQAMSTGLVWPMIGDPQGGQSMPALIGPEGVAKHKALDPEGVYLQLLALREAMYERSRILTHKRWSDEDGQHVGISFYDPQVTGLKMLLYVFDEAHMACGDPVWGSRLVPVLSEVLKMAGKTGIIVWLATQYPSIEELGNKMAIKQQLLAGNVIAYRNSVGVSKSMILPSHMPPPLAIPKETPDGDHTKGTAVIYSAAPRSSRATYARSVWARRAHFWAQQAAAKVGDLDDATMEALAKHLPDLGSSSGAAPAETAPAREQVTVTPRKRQPTWMDRIEEYLRSCPAGQAHTGVIATALDADLPAISGACGRGEKAGRVHQVRRGVWALGTASSQRLEADAEAVA